MSARVGLAWQDYELPAVVHFDDWPVIPIQNATDDHLRALKASGRPKMVDKLCQGHALNAERKVGSIIIAKVEEPAFANLRNTSDGP